MRLGGRHESRAAEHPAVLDGEDVDRVLIVELVALASVGNGQVLPLLLADVDFVTNPVVLQELVFVEVTVLRSDNVDHGGLPALNDEQANYPRDAGWRVSEPVP